MSANSAINKLLRQLIYIYFFWVHHGGNSITNTAPSKAEPSGVGHLETLVHLALEKNSRKC